MSYLRQAVESTSQFAAELMSGGRSGDVTVGALALVGGILLAVLIVIAGKLHR